MIHGIGFNAQPNQRFNERILGERLESLRNDRITISQIISSNCNKSLQEIEDAMYRGVVWTSEQALEYKLAHEIRDELYERGADVLEISTS